MQWISTHSFFTIETHFLVTAQNYMFWFGEKKNHIRFQNNYIFLIFFTSKHKLIVICLHWVFFLNIEFHLINFNPHSWNVDEETNKKKITNHIKNWRKTNWIINLRVLIYWCMLCGGANPTNHCWLPSFILAFNSLSFIFFLSRQTL